MTFAMHTTRTYRRRSFGARLTDLFFALVALRRGRLALDRLDPRLLKDIGVTREEARREARKAFWDVPEHWLR